MAYQLPKLLELSPNKHQIINRVFYHPDVSPCIPVQNAESKVDEEEDHQVMPDQLEDAALPPQQEVPDAVQPVGRVLVHVGVDAGVQPLPLSPHVDDGRPHRNCCKTEKLFCYAAHTGKKISNLVHFVM